MELKLFRRFQVECTCDYAQVKDHEHQQATGKMKTVTVPAQVGDELRAATDPVTHERTVEIPETVTVKVPGGVPLITLHEVASDGDRITYGGVCARCDEVITVTVSMEEAGLRRTPEGASDASTEPEPAALPAAD